MFFEIVIHVGFVIIFDQNLANHVKENTPAASVGMFKTVLISFINPEQERCLLAKKNDWDSLEKEFAPLYGSVGRPSIPIRTIVGLLLLK